MRQEQITGYILHQRAYRESSRLVDFFSQEHGLIRGVLRGAGAKSISKGKTSPQQFVLYTAYADGTGGLKRISKLETVSLDGGGYMSPLQGQSLYAGMYANELLIKLLAIEDVMHHSYYAYAHTVLTLASISEDLQQDINEIKRTLRTLEYNLLGELGYGINFEYDNNGNAFSGVANYMFVHGEGFCMHAQGNISGAWLQSFDAHNITIDDVNYLGRVFKQTIDALLDHKPLKSREMWASLYGKR